MNLCRPWVDIYGKPLLNSLHKNTVLLRNGVCSITTCKKQRNTGFLFENMYFYCTYSIKTKILSMLGTGYFLKIVKINFQQKNQSVPIAKISSRKTKKSPIGKNKLPQKFRATRYANQFKVNSLGCLLSS